MTEDTNSKAKSCLMGCGLAAIMPVVLIIIFAAILMINNRPPSIVVPSHTVPKVNAWDDFKLATSTVHNYGPYDSGAPDSWTMPRLEAFVKGNEPMLAVLRRGFSKEYRHPSVRTSDSIEFEVYARLRGLARMLRGEAAYYRKNSEYGKAADCLLDGVELGVTLPRGAVFVTHLVGGACESIATGDLPNVIKKLDERQLEHVAKRLEVIESKRWPYSETILEEGRYNAAIYTHIFADPTERNNIINPRNWVEASPLGFTAWCATGPTISDRLKLIGPNARLALMNKTNFVRQIVEFHEAAAAEQSKPYTGKSKIIVPSDFINDICYIEFATARASSCKAEAKLALIQANVAIRRYFIDNGRYPDNLAQLVPKYLKTAPIDPFGNGKPIKYLPPKGGESFIVYSLGENLTDDGGTPGKWRGAPASGDLVLGQGEK